MRTSPRLARVVIGLVVVLTGCVPADGDEAVSTVAAPESLDGGPDVLLPRLVDTVDELSEAIIGDGDETSILAEAENIWAAVRSEVETADPDAYADMAAMMDLARTSVTRKRPADADKATKYLGDLVSDHLERG